MRRNRIAALFVSGLLGVGAAGGVAACGDSEGSREAPERGNVDPGGGQGETPEQTQTGPETLGATGPEQPQITQSTEP
jgi:hypothetical protein